MNLLPLKITGTPRPIGAFPALASIWSEQYGHCFKATSLDGLAVVNIQTGHRFSVWSNAEFYAVEEPERADR